MICAANINSVAFAGDVRVDVGSSKSTESGGLHIHEPNFIIIGGDGSVETQENSTSTFEDRLINEILGEVQGVI